MKGRKPKDLAMKLLSGNPGKRTFGGHASENAFTAGRLTKPRGLDKYASREWDKLVKTLAPILSPASGGMVLIAASAYSEMMQADAVLATGGLTYTTESKKGPAMTRERPEVGIRQRARRAYHQALAELGASPVAHTRVKKLPESNQPELPGISRLLG
jgi:P27 family predicted phage terminase small subunit